MDDKLALSGTVVRKTGDGYYTGTWTDAWAYFFGATYNLNDQHRVSILCTWRTTKAWAESL